MCCPQFSLNLEVELDSDPGTFGGSATNRKCTDIFGLVIMILIFGAVIGLSVYCILNSDIEKLINGYDKNGNICGRKNNKNDWPSIEGFGEDMERLKYVLITKFDKKLLQECIPICVFKCPKFASNYCADSKLIPYYMIMLEYWKYVLASWLFSVLFAIEISRLTYSNSENFFFKYRVSIWMFLNTLGLWAYFGNSYRHDDDYTKEFLTLSIIATVAILLYLPWLYTNQMSLKFDLVFQLYREAWEAIKVTNLFWLLPLLSSLMIIVFVILLSFCWIWLQSFSYLDQIKEGEETRTDYVQYTIATVTGALAIYAFLLLYEIVKNCQCMMVGGYVSQWYFTRKDGALTKPTSKTIANLLKYHLGTICWGSLILPIVYVVRAMVNAIKGAASGHNKESVYTCTCRLLTETCLQTCIPCLDSFSQNGFIMTAMHGCTFCTGSIRAHKLISHNNFNVLAIKSLGDSIIFTYKFASSVSTFLFCYTIIRFMPYDNPKQIEILMIYIVIVSAIITDICLFVIEVTKDTIFLCFCEDCFYNNGTSQPFNMSSNFAQFIEGANKYVDPVTWKEVADKWEKGPRRLY